MRLRVDQYSILFPSSSKQNIWMFHQNIGLCGESSTPSCCRGTERTQSWARHFLDIDSWRLDLGTASCMLGQDWNLWRDKWYIQDKWKVEDWWDEQHSNFKHSHWVFQIKSFHIRICQESLMSDKKILTFQWHHKLIGIQCWLVRSLFQQVGLQ